MQARILPPRFLRQLPVQLLDSLPGDPCEILAVACPAPAQSAPAQQHCSSSERVAPSAQSAPAQQQCGSFEEWAPPAQSAPARQHSSSSEGASHASGADASVHLSFNGERAVHARVGVAASDETLAAGEASASAAADASPSASAGQTSACTKTSTHHPCSRSSMPSPIQPSGEQQEHPCRLTSEIQQAGSPIAIHAGDCDDVASFKQSAQADASICTGASEVTISCTPSLISAGHAPGADCNRLISSWIHRSRAAVHASNSSVPAAYAANSAGHTQQPQLQSFDMQPTSSCGRHGLHSQPDLSCHPENNQGSNTDSQASMACNNVDASPCHQPRTSSPPLQDSSSRSASGRLSCSGTIPQNGSSKSASADLSCSETILQDDSFRSASTQLSSPTTMLQDSNCRTASAAQSCSGSIPQDSSCGCASADQTCSGTTAPCCCHSPTSCGSHCPENHADCGPSPTSGATAAPGHQDSADNQPQGVFCVLLIPCKQALRGRFPLNGTYFQTNEVFLVEGTIQTPVLVSRRLCYIIISKCIPAGTSGWPLLGSK